MPQLPSFPMPPGGMPQGGAPGQLSVPPPTGAPVPDGAGAPDQQPQGMPLKGRPPVGGLNPDFAHRFVQLQKAVREAGGDLYVFSGARDKQHQQQLFEAAVGKYGDPKVAQKHVKPPGKSSHDPAYGAMRGLGMGAVGVDIRGDLAIAHKLAPQVGLEFPNKDQPWHLEMAGISKLKA